MHNILLKTVKSMVVHLYNILYLLYAFSDDDEYCRVTHVSIIVLAIYTFGISLLLWWLYKGVTNLCCNDIKDDSKGAYIQLLLYISSRIYCPYIQNMDIIGYKPYGIKQWWGKTLANLTKRTLFANILPSQILDQLKVKV